MRRSHKLVLMLAGAAALVTTGIGSIPTSHAATSSSTIDSLRAQRAALVQELATMQPDISVAQGQMSGAESAYSSQQQKVLSQQKQLNTLNNHLMSLNQQLQANEATTATDKQQLAEVIRATWESNSTDQVLIALLSAQDFSQAVDRLKAATQVSQQVQEFVSQLATQDKQIKQEQAQIKTQFDQASFIENQLSSTSGQLLADLENRNQFFNMLNGPARQVAEQIANIDNQIAALEMPAFVGSGPCGDNFAYGQCTWYVASRRCIPWGGNANQWYYNAGAMGFQEGHTPAPGAVVVFWPGGDGASSIGHVAYVEAVGPTSTVPAGYFLQSEMNFFGNGGGWARVSYRVLPNNSSGIQGFIYNR
ncbi:MAG TPA: CHAP domain-containing protein [Candidatus Dormibacteraeota bacterium]